MAWLQEFRNTRKSFWGKIMSFNDKLAYDGDYLFWGCTFFICSGCVSFGEAELVGTGVQKSPVRGNLNPFSYSGWVEGLMLNLSPAMWIIQVAYLVFLPVFMGSFSPRVKASGRIQVVREVQSTFPSNAPPCPPHLLEDNCHGKYLCEQLLGSGK